MRVSDTLPLVEPEPVRPPAPGWTTVMLAIVLSAALVVPCLWTDRIQAGDLSSHLYNAWLARQAAAGQLPGLEVRTVWTNVLGDLLLSTLLGPAGPVWTERIVEIFAVLVFFWGALFLLRQMAGTWPWMLAPFLAMLAYGLIFHLGFLNHYLSTGLCMWAAGLIWQPTAKRVAAAVGITLLAITAHAFAVLWIGAVLAYVAVWKVSGTWLRLALPAIGLAALLGLQTLIAAFFPFRWSLEDLVTIPGLAGITGVEQVWLFGPKYLFVVVGLFVLWTHLLLRRLDRPAFFTSPLVQLWVLHMAAYVLLPAAIKFPQYDLPLTYIPQRLSLLTALTLMMVVADVKVRRATLALSSALATVFFGLMYIDARAHSRVEEHLAQLIQTLPPDQRVVAAIAEPEMRIPGLLHAIDRACLDHCFSYGNYEPASKQFRLRVTRPNPFVADSITTVRDIEDGVHMVTAAEAPLYAVCPTFLDGIGLELRRLRQGERVCSFSIKSEPAVRVLIGER